MSMAQKNSPRTEGDELGHKDKDRPSSSRRQSLNFTHDLHHQLLSQVRNWLEQEKLKQPPHAHHSNESDAGSTSEQHASQLSGSDTLTSLQKLEQILEEHNWLIQAARNIVNKDSSAKRKLSMLGLKRGSSYPASSDTEYQDLDVKVPSVEAVLDNSKTLSYTGGAIDAQDEDVKEDIKGAKEQEGWLKFKNEIVRLAHTLRLKGWRQVPLDQGGDIEVQRLSGALTNAVYVVSPPRNLPQPTKNGSSTSLTIKKPKWVVPFQWSLHH